MFVWNRPACINKIIFKVFKGYLHNFFHYDHICLKFNIKQLGYMKRCMDNYISSIISLYSIINFASYIAYYRCLYLVLKKCFWHSVFNLINMMRHTDKLSIKTLSTLFSRKVCFYLVCEKHNHKPYNLVESLPEAWR